MEREGVEKRKPEKKSVIFVIHKDGKILLEDRTCPGRTYYGYRIIPGGKFEAEKDADYEDAVRREVLEECGIDILEMVRLDKFLSVSVSNHLYEIEAYLITKYEGEVLNTENKSEHVWVDLDNAENELLFVDMKYVILLARQYVNERLPKGG